MLSKQHLIILSKQTEQSIATQLLVLRKIIHLKSSFRLMLLLSYAEFLIYIVVIREIIVLVRMRQAQKTQCLHIEYLPHGPLRVAQWLSGTVRLKENAFSVTF